MPIARPVFRMFDYKKAVEFYVDWLGFTINWEDRKENLPIYMEIGFGDLIIHLSEHHGDATPGSRIHIEDFPSLAEYQQLLIAKNYTYNKPGLEKAFWNPQVLTMEVIDPFGNRLTFTGNISPS